MNMNKREFMHMGAVFGALASASSLSHAQFGALLGGGAKSGANVDVKGLLVSARDAMTLFASAGVGLGQALGKKQELESSAQLLQALKSGDVAPTKETFETLVKVDSTASQYIKEQAQKNLEIDAEGKALASKSMVQYVGGLVSAKSLVEKFQGVSSNPMALANDAPSVLYVVKALPPIVTSGVSTTSMLFSFLQNKGIDISEAKKAGSSLGV
jgi:hypothetical protein